MKPGKRVPRKVWLLLAVAVAAGIMSLSSGTGFFSSKSERDVFLDGVAADLAKQPRVTVVRVDREAGLLVVRVNTTGKTLFFVVTQVESKKLPDGRVLQQLEYAWKDESGKVLALGRSSGTQTGPVHVDVPGLQ